MFVAGAAQAVHGNASASGAAVGFDALIDLAYRLRYAFVFAQR